MKAEALDKKGFVFIDDSNRPYWVVDYHGTPMLMYWHKDKKWVTLRKVNDEDILRFRNISIPDEEAKMYHDQHEKSIPKLFRTNP